MKTKVETQTFKDKFLLLPLGEFAWENANKILTVKFGFLKWTVKFKFNF